MQAAAIFGGDYALVSVCRFRFHLYLPLFVFKRVAGNYIGGSNDAAFFYNSWGGGTNVMQCSSGYHYMMDVNPDSNGNTAWFLVVML